MKEDEAFSARSREAFQEKTRKARLDKLIAASERKERVVLKADCTYFQHLYSRKPS